MPGSIDRRTFLKRTGTAAVAVLAAPLVIPSRVGAAGDRPAMAGGPRGAETTFALRASHTG